MAWDQALSQAEDYTVFQSFAWGEYKKQTNWLPLRYCCFDKNGKILGLVQLLVKKLFFGLTFIWAPGGVVFCFPNYRFADISKLIQSLIAEIRIDYSQSLIRFHSHLENNSALSFSINKACFYPYFKINSGYTVHFKLDQESGQLRQKMTKKHRYYTKIAAAVGISWSVGNNNKLLTDLVKIHQEMVENKQLSSIATNYNELEKMRNMLGNKVLILTGYLDNIPVSACLVLIFGSKSHYLVASTGKQGREVYAAYAMFERLINELMERGVTEFDFGGIDPVNRSAAGVNHYKCGFGGQIVEQLGEWESASSEFIRVAINLAIRMRRGRV